MTPLHSAASNGHLEVCRRMVAAGARLDGRDYQGHTAQDIARKAGARDVAAFLAEAEQRPSAGNDSRHASTPDFRQDVADLAELEENSVDPDNDDGEEFMLGQAPIAAHLVLLPSATRPRRARASGQPTPSKLHHDFLAEGGEDPHDAEGEQSADDDDVASVSSSDSDLLLGPRMAPLPGKVYTLADIAMTHAKSYTGQLGPPARYDHPTLHGATAGFSSSDPDEPDDDESLNFSNLSSNRVDPIDTSRKRFRAIDLGRSERASGTSSPCGFIFI